MENGEICLARGGGVRGQARAGGLAESQGPLDAGGLLLGTLQPGTGALHEEVRGLVVRARLSSYVVEVPAGVVSTSVEIAVVVVQVEVDLETGCPAGTATSHIGGCCPHLSPFA